MFLLPKVYYFVYKRILFVTQEPYAHNRTIFHLAARQPLGPFGQNLRPTERRGQPKIDHSFHVYIVIRLVFIQRGNLFHSQPLDPIYHVNAPLRYVSVNLSYKNVIKRE